MVKNRLEI